MKHIIPFTLALPLLLVVPAGMSACSTTQMVGEQTDDNTIKTRVGARLAADPDVRRFQIDVDVLDRVVTLRGDIEDPAAAEEAVRIAENTEGVERVINELQIVGEDKMLEGDGGIQSAVSAKLIADPDVRRFNIDVDVVNGVVYLSGVVHDEEAKAAAERIANGVDGVVRVENELKVSPDDEPLSTDKDDEKATDEKKPAPQSNP
ncbi:MAG: BON domain-containing protein [Deltaproteobacteria bacterium]|nr:BON domain-containing protein [Deltaproteobacteria bacterium]